MKTDADKQQIREYLCSSNGRRSIKNSEEAGKQSRTNMSVIGCVLLKLEHRILRIIIADPYCMLAFIY